MATRAEIQRWFEDGVAQKSAYMVVMCDTYDWDDYPVYAGDRSWAERLVKSPVSMQKVMEVYDLQDDMQRQMSMHRCNALA